MVVDEMARTTSPSMGMMSSLSKNIEMSQWSGRLELTSSSINRLPDYMDNYDISDVMIVDISKNKFAEVPEDITKCENLEELNCYHNMIRSIDKFNTVNLRFLSKLNLSRNLLSSLPAHICLLPLTELNVSNNKLEALPTEIGKLVKLVDLDISSNSIAVLPEVMGELVSLKDLNARNNFITHVPTELSKLPLVRLDLSYNRIAMIPTDYRNLHSLQYLDIENNPLITPPAKEAKRGKVHIFKFLDVVVWQDEKRQTIEQEQRFRKDKEDERQRSNYSNPRGLSSSANNTFANDVLDQVAQQMGPQAKATLLVDPYFGKELEKDKIYKEKYGINDDYIKRSLQVAQGHGMNTINRASKSQESSPKETEKISSPSKSKTTPGTPEKEKRKARSSLTKGPKSELKAEKKLEKAKSESPKSSKGPKITAMPKFLRRMGKGKDSEKE